MRVCSRGRCRREVEDERFKQCRECRRRSRHYKRRQSRRSRRPCVDCESPEGNPKWRGRCAACERAYQRKRAEELREGQLAAEGQILRPFAGVDRRRIDPDEERRQQTEIARLRGAHRVEGV